MRMSESSEPNGIKPLNLESVKGGEPEKRNGVDWMLEVVEVGRKTNENVVSVLGGGSIVHAGYGLTRFRDLLSEQEKVEIEEGIRERVKGIVETLASQDPKTKYSSDLVEKNLTKLENLAKGMAVDEKSKTE